MEIKKIEKELDDFLQTKNIKLFEMKYYKSNQTLEVLLDEDFDLDQIEEVSNEISAFLDNYEDEFDDNYILDVSNIGIERPIRNEEELIKAINSYIYVKGKEFEYYGTLLNYEDGIIHLQTMGKNIKKNISVNYSKVKKARYAVKF